MQNVDIKMTNITLHNKAAHRSCLSKPFSIRYRWKIILSIIFFFFVWTAFTRISNLDNSTTNGQKVNNNHQYKGYQYWKEGVTLNARTIYETKFARFQIHKIGLQGDKEEEQKIIDDWLWFDECDNVNILVENADGNFVVLYQHKYAILEKTYAIVGGLVEPSEVPLDAAKRELKEELNMVSSHWIELGTFRAAANRGGGMTHTFFARKSQTIQSSSNTSNVDNNNGKAISPTAARLPVEGELERQDIVEITRDELLEKLLSGKFQEIKWTATIALALLKTRDQ